MASSGVRLAVVGLYNSGSTCVAGILHRLGVNMGAPYWKTSDDGAATNYYEPYDLAWHLRRWWDQPYAIERIPERRRIEILRNWVRLQESIGGTTVGAKHPLLSLCVNDLLAAWGPAVRIIRVCRSPEASIAGLQRRMWFVGFERQLQQRLWTSLEQFEATCPGYVKRIEWDLVLANPREAVQELAEFAALDPSAHELERAEQFVRHE